MMIRTTAAMYVLVLPFGLLSLDISYIFLQISVDQSRRGLYLKALTKSYCRAFWGSDLVSSITGYSNTSFLHRPPNDY